MATSGPFEDTHNPSVVPFSLKIRSTAIYWLIGSLVAVFMLAGVVALFWSAAHPRQKFDPSQGDVAQNFAYYSTQGGHDPILRPANTRAELKFRGFPEGY